MSGIGESVPLALTHVLAGGVVTTLPRMAKPSMEVNISFRVPRALRDAAREKAEERQENVSDVLREALERYVKSKR